MILTTGLIFAGVLYVFAVLFCRQRYATWPVYRTVFWLLGILFALPAFYLHTNFTGHMVGHLLLGMLSPLCMVLAKPITLAMRSIPVAAARRLSSLLKSKVFIFMSDPITASLLNIGGLWLLYTTSLYAHMHGDAVLYELIHLHIWLAGYVFTASIISLDPRPHQRSIFYRAIVLVSALAGHGILAKYIYANPPHGVSAEEAGLGGELMYYGGDAIHLVMIIIFCHQWYQASHSNKPREIIFFAKIQQ